MATEVAKLVVIVNYFSQFINASGDLFPADFSEWKRGLSPTSLCQCNIRCRWKHDGCGHCLLSACF